MAEGTELLGEYQSSGRAEAPFLVRLGDGRMVEISPLLYLLARELARERDLTDVATTLSTKLGRTISVESLSYLIDRKLCPLGIIRCPVDPPPDRTCTTRAAGLAVHVGIIPTKVVGAVARFLSPLFRPPVLAAAIGGLVVVDGLLLRSLDRGLSIDELLLQPSHLLTVIGLIMVGGAFHEFGHATATRYGGAQPGVIGAGIYLLWPVFYNDLNDSYRLSRAGRLRADLGGVYFNTLFILALAAAYGLTGFEPLVAAIVFQHLSVLQQFLPFLRLDGYYIVSDVAGVPDLFGYVRPVLRRLVPWHTKPTVVDQLKRGARIIVTIWVLLTVPLVAGCLVFAVATVPDVASATWRSISIQASVLSSTTEPVDAVLSGLQLLVLAVPCVGLIVPMVRMLRRSRLGAGRRGVI